MRFFQGTQHIHLHKNRKRIDLGEWLVAFSYVWAIISRAIRLFWDTKNSTFLSLGVRIWIIIIWHRQINNFKIIMGAYRCQKQPSHWLIQVTYKIAGVHVQRFQYKGNSSEKCGLRKWFNLFWDHASTHIVASFRSMMFVFIVLLEEYYNFFFL